MISKIAKKVVPALWAGTFCLLLCGCATKGGGISGSVITGRAIDINTCHPVAGQAVRVFDVRPYPSFGLGPPPTIGTTTTGPDGKFHLVVPGKYKDKDIIVWLTDVNGDYYADKNPGWRIVDVMVSAGSFGTVITGRAVDINTGPPLAGQILRVMDTRHHFFVEASSPPVIGTTTTGPNGKFRLAVPGKYNEKYIRVEFEGDASKKTGWRIVDLSVDR